ncbi:MAG TPA: squalene--hopene cyclase [Solibacterales bacterium]|nr:squalene--hopene cyclase [Bryobacterales bacterium]
MSTSFQVADAALTSAARAMRRAADRLLAIQDPQGYWWGDLTADTTLEADYILLELWLHPPENGVWSPPTRARIGKAVASILARQLPDGGFNIYAHGPAEISACVKAYFALKLAGVSIDDPRMARLRERILEMGGIQAANSYVKINLSLFDLYPRQHVPSVPPELMLAGNVIYEMSSWTRAIVIPLSIVQALNTGRPVPAGFHLEEIYKPGVSCEFRRDAESFTWRNLFLKFDRILKWWERRGPRGLREKAIRRAEQWMLERTKHSDGLGAIYPPMMYAIMALDLLGYPPDHPDRVEAQRQFDNLIVDDERGFYFQPCFSPVWDTAIAAFALGETGLPVADALRPTADWLLTKEVRQKGDWSVKRPHLEPSGWYFEFANEFYPDIDDTAMVLLGLLHAPASDRKAFDACIRRAVAWLLEMQSKDGGWAAFDVDNDWQPLSYVPFADHNAMLDPTCPDITGRVMEALCAWGADPQSAAIRRGVEYLLRTQESDGSWYGRWGVDYIYGTFLALRGLRAAGESDREAYILRAGEWLRSIQNADGGWGEDCASYNHNTFVPAPSTPSQTAWAVLGLIAGGDTRSISVQKGIEYLVETQRPDGGWDEELNTGTGFPKVFYLMYHLYRHTFPLLALGAYLKARGAKPHKGQRA